MPLVRRWAIWDITYLWPLYHTCPTTDDNGVCSAIIGRFIRQGHAFSSSCIPRRTSGDPLSLSMVLSCCKVQRKKKCDEYGNETSREWFDGSLLVEIKGRI